MKKVATAVDEESFNHRLLWYVVSRQFQHAASKPRGSYHDHLVAMVFAFHSFEAYLNFLGQRLAPDISAQKRSYVGKKPYYGFAGKLKKILELLHVNEPSRTRRPYKTVWLLKSLRDQIAHAKAETFSFTVEHAPGRRIPFTIAPFGGVVTEKNAQQAYVDIEKLADRLHIKARAKLRTTIMGDWAFRGILSLGSGSTRIAA